MSKQLIDRAVDNVNDEDVVLECAKEAHIKRSRQEQSLIGDFYEELNIRLTDQPTADLSIALLNAVLRSGDLLTEDDWFRGPLILSAGIRFDLLLKSVLKRLGEQRARDCLLIAYEKVVSVPVGATVWVSRARELGVIPTEGASADCPITVQTLTALQRPLLDKIKAAQDDGSLSKAPFYFDIAQAWAYISGPDPVKGWINDVITQDPEFLATLSYGLVGKSISEARSRYHYRGGDEPIYLDVEALRLACARYEDSAVLTPDKRERVKALLRGLEKRGAHVSPLDDLFDEDEPS